ncbi:MAG: two-component regulator propeller domain-containing protein [Bacteroidota bacterium]
MYNRSLLLLLAFTAVLLGGNSLPAQTGLIAPIDGWSAYVSHRNALEITKRNSIVYTITAGGLFAYDTENSTIKEFSTIEGLSDINPNTIFLDESSNLIFLGFTDGTINYLDEQENIFYISDIERTELFTNKKINRFASEGNLLYIATEFGIVVYDIARKETRVSVTKIGTSPSGSPVKDIAIANGRLWAAMENRSLWSIGLTENNISLPGVWRDEGFQNGLTGNDVSFVCNQAETLFCKVADTIFMRLQGQNWTLAPFPYRDYSYLNANSQGVFANFGSLTDVLYADGTLLEIDNEGTLNSSYVDGADVYVGDRSVGLIGWNPGPGFEAIGPQGPKNNFVTDLAAGNGELYVAPRGILPPSARRFDKSGIPYFNLHGGGWRINDTRSGDLSADSVYQDFVRACYDKNTGTCYIGSWGEGIVELKDGKVVRTYTEENSGLNSGSPQNLVGGLALDEFGNLWVGQRIAQIPINVKTPEGVWYEYTPPVSMTPFGMMIDDFNNKWIISAGQGLVVFNDNFTLDDPTDDRYKTITSNFGGGGLPNNSVTSVAQDLDQQIWIGTSEGITIIYDPSVIWTTDFQDAACPIIDGFCLLRDQRVNDIAVDGANRKWLATENGAYLVNEDGTQLLQHFTTANSPLFDNDIKAVAIDNTTGEVFFGTNKGTISYIGRSIDGRTDASELYAFPNPVLDDFEGDVMIKGMRSFSKVKITTVDGRLVRELDSFGGEVPWDRKDTFGNAVRPGIYLVMVADDNGEGAGITKLAIVERQN